MTTPSVTELERALEPLAPDPFIDDLCEAGDDGESEPPSLAPLQDLRGS